MRLRRPLGGYRIGAINGLCWGLLLALLLSACSGGLTVTLPRVPGTRATSSISVRFYLAGPVPTAAAARLRRPRFVSADTAGVAIGFTGSATISTTLNIAPGSTSCGGSSASPRTCSGTIAVPAGSYTLTASTYDAAPVSNAIPSNAHKLATVTMTGVTVVAGQANQTNVYVGGVVTAFSSGASFVSLPADGATHQLSFALNPTDYDNEPITAGTNDPYSNPITLTLSETGGSGHEVLTLNGSTVGASATILHSTDTVAVSYDGGGAPGYSGSVAIAASGVATSTVTVSPMYVRGSAYYSGSSLAFLAAGETSTLQVTEASAPGSVTYTFVPSAGCSGVASASAVSGSGASATSLVTAGATVSGSGCSAVITDSLGTSTAVTISITTTQTNGSVAIPGQILEYGSGITANANITGITQSKSGLIWFTEPNNNRIGILTPSTHAIVEKTTGISTGAKPYGITETVDGFQRFTENGLSRLASMGDTTYTVTETSYGLTANADLRGIAMGTDGTTWFAEYATSSVGHQTFGSTFSQEYPTPTASAGCSYIVAGPDGQMWFTETTANQIGTINIITHVISEFSSGITAGSAPTGIASGPDGNIWFTEGTGNKIGKINPSTHAVTEYANGITASAGLMGIVTGPDGNLYFAESTANKIGRITTSGTVTEFSIGITSGAHPGFLAVGPDGNIYFTEPGANQIGVLTL